MSDITVTIQTISDMVLHANADKLEIAKILGTQTIVPKGQYKVGDAVVYFPPDILLPAAVSDSLGVQQYLKHAPFDGQKIACRVGACRLRGVPSYGFVVPISLNGAEGYIDPPYAGTTAYGHTFDVAEYVRSLRQPCYVSEGRPLSNQAWQIASGRARGGISGDRKRFANEEWLSLVN
jgi:RNA ligase (TIGR02306 family)